MRALTNKGSLVKIAYRAIDLALTEIGETEAAPRSGFCDERERILIAPSIVVHGTTEIDPGLIRINMAYGFMKAFDRDQLRRRRINVLQYYLWDAVTEEIIAARLYCHRHETLIAHHGIFTNPSAETWLRGIRERKNRIAELMEERFDWFGVDAFPRIMSDPMLGDQTALDWTGTWEMHLGPERSWLAGIDLWTPQILWTGTLGEDGPGSPPVRESNIAAHYLLPAAMIAVLQHH
jgi:hypothetical protein